jgi:hypothetical protein
MAFVNAGMFQEWGDFACPIALGRRECGENWLVNGPCAANGQI